MEWFFSLFNSLCPFCAETLGSSRRACASCAEKLRNLEQTPPIRNQIKDIEIISCGSYEGFLRGLILRQKKYATPVVVEWFCNWLLRTCPKEWRKLPMAWVPSSPIRKIHLVEELILELHKHGVRLASLPLVHASIKPKASQKKRTLIERSKNDDKFFVKTTRREFSKVVLLDDVCTSGNTIFRCKNLIEKKLGIGVEGALTLAFTPKPSSE